MEPEALVGLGDHPALDYLNSTATPSRETVELLSGGAQYVHWLRLAGLISLDELGEVQARFTAVELDEAARSAIALREELRPAVAAWASGAPGIPGADVLARLNGIFEAGSRRPELTRSGSDLMLEDRRGWETWQSLLAPVAEAVADLFVQGERDLVRHCEGLDCTLWFYDRTKSHRRRWCSMAVCGNRAKVREHRARTAGHAKS